MKTSALAALAILLTAALTASPATAAVPSLDLSAANRRAPVSGLPDWSKAGYRGGQNLPGSSDYNPDAKCQLTPAKLAAAPYQVKPNDGLDDSAGLQKAIDDIRTGCSPSASFTRLSLITLPAGVLNVSRQLFVDADYLTLRGAGSGKSGGTSVVFRPDLNTRYDALTPDGGDWDEDGMTCGSGPKGGWIWPGRGLFRVQAQGIHSAYASGCAAANRVDLVKGTVNVHWKAGIKLVRKPGDAQDFAARKGDTVVHLKSSSAFKAGTLVNIRAANSMKMYQEQQALPTVSPLQNLHLRQRIHRVVAVSGKTITLDTPVEYDLPVTSTSDGSEPILDAVYDSKASPLVDPVVGVGFENFAFTQDMAGLPKLGGGTYSLTREQVRGDYGNFAPEYQMHGIVFKWAADSWVRNMRIEMTGSHPIVTEEAKNLQIVDNYLDGSWNKGKGGNGYFRGSRVWDSLYARNTSRNLRHFTFQWSASHNVVIGNDFDSDLNLHGGWERHNLFELNTVRVPFEHSSASCTANCGGEGGGAGGGDGDDSTWYPIWWGAGRKAVKWSGSSGPQNVFFNNAMTKQVTKGGPFSDYTPYGTDQHTVFQFGWKNGQWQHLEQNGAAIADWAGRETANYAGSGVDTSRTDPGRSLFLRTVG